MRDRAPPVGNLRQPTRMFPVYASMFQYVLVLVCTSMYRYCHVPVCSSMFQYVPVCTSIDRYVLLYHRVNPEPCARLTLPRFLSSPGTLSEVNLAAREEDARIAVALRAGGRDDGTAAYGGADKAMALPLHGLVAISCDVCGVNRCAALITVLHNNVYCLTLFPSILFPKTGVQLMMYE